MGKQFYYEIGYHYDCEVCGKTVRGEISVGPLEYNGTVLPKSMATILALADVKLANKRVRDAMAEKAYARMAFTKTGCPFCGARQSWDPLPKPEEKPAKGIGSTVLIGILALAIGVLPALFLFLLLENALVFPISMGVCLALGLWFAIWSNRSENAEAKAAYPEKLQAYNAFMEDVSKRAVHGEPVADWENDRIRPCD